MLRRPLCGMAAGFIAGIAAAAYWERGWLPAGTAAAAVYVCYLLWSVRRRQTHGGRMKLRLAGCIAMFLLGGFWLWRAQSLRGEYLPYLSGGMRVLVQGELHAKKIQNDQYIYELKSCVMGRSMEHQSETASVRCGRILVSSDSDIASIGEILILEGTVDEFRRASNEGSFDEASYYEARGIAFRLEDIRLLSVRGHESRLREGLWRLRLRLKEVYKEILKPEEAGVLITMVLGDKELLDAETKELYRTGGLSHIMAISGLHISVIGMAVYRFWRRRGLGFWAAGAAAGGIMCAYGTMVGFGISVQRAVLMFLLMLLAGALGRSYDTLSALGAAALFLLWGNPFLLWDAGFQFSFAAVTGAAWVSGCVSFARTVWGKAGSALFSGAAVQLATLPLAAWYYFEIPVYAMLMNLLILPAMGLLLAAGVAGGIVGLWSPGLAAAALFPCQKLLSLIRLLCSVCAGLPQAVYVTGRPPLARLAVYYGALAACTLYAYRRKRRKSAGGDDAAARKPKAGERRGRFCGDTAGKSGVIRTSVGILCFLALLCVPPRRGFELDVLDVGQGDGCFVRTVQNNTIFVDGGSSDVRKVGEYRILPFLKYNGVRRIDCWIVSHADSDHISGLKELLSEGYEIRSLVLSAGIVRDEAFLELTELAAQNGTRVEYMDAGDSLYLGGAKLVSLFPAGGAKGTDRNAASLVIWYEEGEFTALFTGDIGTAEEEELLRSGWFDGDAGGSPPESGTETRVGPVTFYKAAHHGSDYSNSGEFLQELRPLVAVVSCAAGNSYGHPGKEAVAHMEESGSGVFYTMESGQIRLTIRDGAVRVWRYCEDGPDTGLSRGAD